MTPKSVFSHITIWKIPCRNHSEISKDLWRRGQLKSWSNKASVHHCVKQPPTSEILKELQSEPPLFTAITPKTHLQLPEWSKDRSEHLCSGLKRWKLIREYNCHEGSCSFCCHLSVGSHLWCNISSCPHNLRENMIRPSRTPSLAGLLKAVCNVLRDHWSLNHKVFSHVCHSSSSVGSGHTGQPSSPYSTLSRGHPSLCHQLIGCGLLFGRYVPTTSYLEHPIKPSCPTITIWLLSKLSSSLRLLIFPASDFTTSVTDRRMFPIYWQPSLQILSTRFTSAFAGHDVVASCCFCFMLFVLFFFTSFWAQVKLIFQNAVQFLMKSSRSCTSATSLYRNAICLNWQQ